MKKVLIVLVVLVVVFVGAVSMRPSEFHVERSNTMAAAPQTVFAYINDFHKFAEWSPWEGKDPSMKKEFSGPNEGVGASVSWVGTGEVGEGKQTITESVPPTKMVEKLEFKKPFEATNTVTFTVSPTEGGGSKVTWAMDGNQNFGMKAASMFMDMDKMVGKDFEDGLAKLKTVAEKKAKDDAAAAAAKAAADAAAAAAAAPTGPTGPATPEPAKGKAKKK